MKRKRGSVALLTALIVHASGYAASGDSPAPRIFGAAKVQEVYRVLHDRDALLLQSINDVIKQKDIQDGQVFVTSGSVQECTYHYVTSTARKAVNAYKTVKGPLEILNAGGIIAAANRTCTLLCPARTRELLVDTWKMGAVSFISRKSQSSNMRACPYAGRTTKAGFRCYNPSKVQGADR